MSLENGVSPNTKIPTISAELDPERNSQDEKKKPRKSWTQVWFSCLCKECMKILNIPHPCKLFLDDFELQVCPVSSECRSRLEEERPYWIFWLFWDVLLCYLPIGIIFIGFWRGTWDLGYIIFDKAFEVLQ